MIGLLLYKYRNAFLKEWGMADLELFNSFQNTIRKYDM